ncbi:snf7-family protein [Planoprotostelium fungivorum]|uniref:Snf7-family protein n=1 Tax=Planoprotostelium fungivorum TaxID=1890364 RepID=A0A2P6NC02_9EUKA|nr:snf7-family protein [Planoprotostelium fungivorum]
MSGLENQLFNLKFTAKSFGRLSTKCEKNEKLQKLKLKQAIEKGNIEGARIYAENAIREKNQALNYLRLSSRLDAVSSRLEVAVRMKAVTKSMQGIVKGLDSAMKSMDMNKITAVMDQFEKQFEDLDVQSDYIEQSMNASTSVSTPVDQVDLLISQVAEEHGLAVSEQLHSGPILKPTTEQSVAEQDELGERLAKLKSKT